MNIRGAIVLVFALALSTAAYADCKPLGMITTVNLTASSDKREAYVPVTIGGVSKRMLLDTGGAFSEITPEAADELKLSRRTAAVAQYDVSGKYTDQFVETSLQIGSLELSDEGLIVDGTPKEFGDDTTIAGILGPDVLHRYDIHIDFGANTLSFLSQDHCEGKVIYWPASAVAAVPMRVVKSGHIFVSVLLDGQPVTALIDTGASNSILYSPAAEALGLKLGSADTPAVGTLLDDPKSKTFEHTFKTLDFEGVAVGNLRVGIIPDMNSDRFANAPEIGSRIADKKNDENSDMLIGMDVLRHLHLYIAYKEQKLYITPADAPLAK